MILSATNTLNYALFGGGAKSGADFATVDAYNHSLVKSSPNALSAGRINSAATNLGLFAIFAGGNSYNSSNYYSNVDIYYDSLVRSTGSNLQDSRASIAATTIGDYALFGGGTTPITGTSGVEYRDTVEVYINENSSILLSVYQGSKYKFQNMDEEVTVTSNIEEISIPVPATGYIKFKNTTIS